MSTKNIKYEKQMTRLASLKDKCASSIVSEETSLILKSTKRHNKPSTACNITSQYLDADLVQA